MGKGVSEQELAEAIRKAEEKLRKLARARNNTQKQLDRITTELVETRGLHKGLLDMKRRAQPEAKVEGPENN